MNEYHVTKRALGEARGGDALQAVERAKAGVAEAKANAARQMTDSLLGKASDPPVTIKDARIALQAAEDDLEAHRAVQATLETRLSACETELEWATHHLTNRIREVVCSEVGVRTLVMKFAALRDELERRRRDLRWFDRQFMIPDEFKNWESVETMYEPHPDALSEGTAPWAAALEELASNSDAPLPAV